MLKENLKSAFHVLFIAAPMGVLVGAAIALYDFVVNSLLWDHFRISLSPVTLSLLPIVGLTLTGLILKKFKVASSSMADEVVLAYHNKEVGIPYGTALPKLLASIATMGFGGSAGMEGASKWVGGIIGSFFQDKVNQKTNKTSLLQGKRETLLLAGASAGIAAIFRAPLTGAIMGIESPYKQDLAHEALLHALVASATSYATFVLLRNHHVYFPLSFVYTFNVRDLFYVLPLGVLCGLGSRLFLTFLNIYKKKWSQWQASVLVKGVAGGVLLSVVALVSLKIIGSPVTLQSGLPLANDLLASHYVLWACLFIFAVKLLATVITFGSGGVGGLFVPSATLGAAIGAIADHLFHPSHMGVFTLIGIAAFTGASYNSLLFSAVFIAEATGNPALVVPALLASSIAYLISAGLSNSPSQKKSRSSH